MNSCATHSLASVSSFCKTMMVIPIQICCTKERNKSGDYLHLKNNSGLSSRRAYRFPLLADFLGFGAFGWGLILNHIIYPSLNYVLVLCNARPE